MTSPLWTPSSEQIKKTLLTKFMENVGEQQHRTFVDYDDLWHWSVDELEVFWQSLWDFCGVEGDPGKEVLRNKNDLFNCQFFPNGTLNYAENLLYGVQKHQPNPAIIFRHESGYREEVTAARLFARVSKVQQALRDAGVEKGD